MQKGEADRSQYPDQLPEDDDVVPEDPWNWEDIKNGARRTIIGARKNIEDPSIFHKIALFPLLAWIGLGADGVSSSSYGPPEAFIALGEHTYLAVFLALGTAFTVFIISYAYTRIIEHFPHGGGGYIVATHTLGAKAGVLSGSALLVDYMLTITVSIAACGDALFSFLPVATHGYKIVFELFLILVLIVLNIRGIKESVTILAPIFIVFVVTHIFMIGYGILSHLSQIGPVAHDIHANFKIGLSSLGGIGMLALFLRAYSLGGGTYTGIEAVSNGIQIMREPRVQTGKKTMLYMSTSLAFTASGLFLCYLLLKGTPGSGKTLNTILSNALYGNWSFGYALALVTILSEGALLFVAAQAGYIDGPRIMANMAIDSWLPHRFASLSERLTMHNGVLLMGGASILLLFYTRGAISSLVVMYSINVFLTFSISEIGMSTYFIKNRKKEAHWKKHLPVHMTGFVLCFTILIVTSYEKFSEGGWMTLVITGAFVALCYLIRGHYNKVKKAVRKLDDLLLDIPTSRKANTETPNPQEMTVVEMAEMAHAAGAMFHTDAVQAVGKVPLNLKDTKIDMLSVSGHKLHAPKGVGVLYLKRGTRFRPLLRGGHQERGRRAGTENTTSIVGLGKAAEMATSALAESARASTGTSMKLQSICMAR